MNLPIKTKVPSKGVCLICGTKHDRDINAAMNILIEGNKILVGSRTTEFTLVDYPTMDELEIY